MFKSMKKVLITVSSLMLVNPVQVFAKTDQLRGNEYMSVGINVTRDQNTFANTVNTIGAQTVAPENIVVVDGNMINRYLHDGSTSATDVFSSSHVQFNKHQTGVNVKIATPQNIQLVSQATYINAAITSGIKDADITVGSEVPVTGEGALVGIYAIMEKEGALNPQNVQLAQEEMNIVSQGAKEANVEPNQLNAVMADVKAEIAQAVQNGQIVNGDQTNINGDQNINNGTVNNNQNYETVNNIVNVALNMYGIHLPPQVVNRLVEYGMNFAQSDVAQNPETLAQLGDLANNLLAEGGSWVQNVSGDVQNKWNDAQFQLQGRNFLQKIGDWFAGLFDGIGNFFSNLFSSEVSVDELNFVNPVTNEEITTLETPQAPEMQEITTQDEGGFLSNFGFGENQETQEQVYQEPVYVEPTYEEPVYQEPVYVEPETNTNW